MRYIFYADVYFLQNFMIKIAVLYLSLYWNRQYVHTLSKKRMGKIVLVAFAGTVLEIIGLLFCASYTIFVAGVHLLEVPLMVGFVLGKERQRMLQAVLSGYFFIILVNGVLEALWNQFGERGSYLFYLLFSCGVVIVGVRIWKNYTRMKKGIFQVEILHKRICVHTRGFYDSGNQLKDPYTGKGVNIVSEQLLKRLGVLQKTIAMPDASMVYIPYKALGNEEGMLMVYYVEEVTVLGEKGRVTIQNCPMGVTKDNLFEGKNYEIILNEEVF